MKRKSILTLCITLCLLLSACGRGANPFRQAESTVVEQSSVPEQEERSPEEEEPSENSQAEQKPVPEEEVQPEHENARQIETTTETGEVPLRRPEAKLLYEIVEDQDGVTESWIEYHYEEEHLTYAEDTILGRITRYDAEGRELTVENSAGAIEEEYRYDAWGCITYLMSINGQERFIYDRADTRVYYLQIESGESIAYTYDDQGQLRSAHFTSEEERYDLAFAYAEDGRNLLVTRQSEGKEELFAEVTYDEKGHVLRQVDHTSEGERVTIWEYNDLGRCTMERSEMGGDLVRLATYTYDANGYRSSSHVEWGDGRTADLVYTRDDEGKVLVWERTWCQADGSESHRIRQEYVYNSQGDCRRIYWQRTSTKSASDKSKTTYYIYDYDGIDPSVDNSYRSME